MDKVEQSACADLNYCSYVFWTCAMKATDCQGGIAQPHHYPGNVSGNTGPTPSRGALRGSGFIKKWLQIFELCGITQATTRLWTAGLC